MQLGVYSSGSVQAQKLLFEHSIFGNLLPYFSNHFDTAVGGKKEPGSYDRILNLIQKSAKDVLFLSDVSEELEAASFEGISVIQLVRDPEVKKSNYPAVSSFLDIPSF